MADESQEFTLTSDTPDDGAYRDGRQIPLPTKRGGRPTGAKNKLRKDDPVWKEARNWTLPIVREMCRRAARMADEIDFRCATVILSRTWPKPRAEPITIDLSQTVDARTLLAAVADGQITPTDASSLWNSISRNGTGASALIEAGGTPDIRQKVAARLAGLIEARQHAVDAPPVSTPVDDDVELEAMFAELQRRDS